MSLVALMKGLSNQGRRVASFMSAFAERGRTAGSAFARTARATAFRVRKREYFQDYIKVKNALKNWNRIKYIGKKRKIKKALIETTSKMKKRYKYVVEVNVSDKETGESKKVYRTVSSNRNLMKGTIEKKGMKSVEESEYYDYAVAGARIRMAFVRERT